MLTAGLISAVIGEQLPGHGTVYLGQTLKFMAPVRPGDRVRAEVQGDGHRSQQAPGDACDALHGRRNGRAERRGDGSGTVRKFD